MTHVENENAFMLSENLRAYYLAVRTLARGKSSIKFPNSSPEHAAIVLSTIIDYSQDIKIYDDCLSGDIADKNQLVEESINRLIKDGRSLKIVVRSDNASQSSIYQCLCRLTKQYPNQIAVKLASTEFKASVVEFYQRDINFAVGDCLAYRAELADASGENERKAQCSFNSPKDAKRLNAVFDEHYSTCTSLDLHCN